MIRSFKEGDEVFLSALEQECFSEPWSRQSFLESFANGTVFLLFTEGEKVLGYAGIQTVLDEGYITNIAVTADARRRGVGKALIDGLKAVAEEKALSFITLEVRKSNIPAISLYEKTGFKNTGIRKNFYSAPAEDAIIMTLEGF